MRLRRVAGVMCGVASAVLLMGAANGRWLDRVPAKAHARVSPFVQPGEQLEARMAGEQLYRQECAKCHGRDAKGMYGRPSLIGVRDQKASDGDLFWMVTNGDPYKGMPPWQVLPEKQRWQLVAYMRGLNEAAAGVSFLDEGAAASAAAKR